MKFFIVVAVCVALSAASVIPSIPRDNSHYVEGESRYVWIPDGEGQPQLVDLLEPVDELALAAARNGANNQYWLFTRQNPTNRQILTNGNLNSVRNSNYRANRPTVVIVHGWNSDGNSNINPMIRDAFLAAQDVNVITLCWGALANSPYTTAMSGVPNVGQHLGNFLIWLFNNIGGNWNQLHLVGFSLGAHVVGNAGRQAGGRPSRVTGLDPAGPFWHNNNNRLQPNAGRYVEAIHSDGGLLGIMDRVANADFYPNGGRNPQPGCGSGATASPCSHGRAFEFFAASVRFNRFVARQCSNIQQAQNRQCNGAAFNMGNGIINKNGNGIFGLTTGSSWPF